MSDPEVPPVTLYRLYDQFERLLYVGITVHPGRRLHDHTSKPWWIQVTRILLEHYPDRPEALAAEIAAIVRERPKYNRVPVLRPVHPPEASRPSEGE